MEFYTIGGQYYAYDGKSDYIIHMLRDEKMPITSIKFSDSYFKSIYKLTPKEAAMHIENMKRGISSIRAEIGWLEKRLSLVSRKKPKNR